MFCSNCGKKLVEGSKFCSGCGSKTSESNEDIKYTSSDSEKLSASAISYYKKGSEYFGQDDYNNAILAYGKALKQEPNFINALRDRAASFMAIGKHTKAIKDLDKAISIDAGDAALYYLRGIVHYHCDEEIVEDDCNDNAMRMMFGDFSDDEDDDIVEDNIELAIMDFSVAIEINEKFVDAYLERANVYMKQQEHDLAIKDYSSVIELEPYNCLHYNKRGWAYYLNDDNNEAIQDYTKAIGIDPENTVAFCNRALVYHYMENYDKSIEDFNSALSLKPDNPTILVNRGKTFMEKKNYEDAIKDICKVIETDQNNIEALSCHGDILCLLDRHLEGKEYYDRVLTINPEYPIGKLTHYADTQAYAYAYAIDENPGASYIIMGESESGSKYLNIRSGETYFQKYENAWKFRKEYHFGFLLQSDANIYINKILKHQTVLDGILHGKHLLLKMEKIRKVYTWQEKETSLLFYFLFDGKEKKILQDIQDGVLIWGEIGYGGQNINNDLKFKSPKLAIEVYQAVINKLQHDDLYLLAYYKQQ